MSETKFDQYPALGSRVAYVRQNMTDGSVEQGTGVVLAIHLDALRRIMVHLVQEKPAVLDDEGQPIATDQPEEKFNVDINCINPDQEFVDNFTAVTEEIKRISEEGNSKSQEIIVEYNQKVEDAYTELLGSPVEIEKLQ